MRKIGAALVSAAFAVGILLAGSYASTTADMRKAKALVAPARPNIIFVVADDMRKDDLEYMPKTRFLLGSKGMTFENAFVPVALCCPSRATIMRGQYAHNTGVWFNTIRSDGCSAYEDEGFEQDNVATRLDAAGYRTGLFGKYLNSYLDTETHVPPGWDRWFATQQSYFDYDANDQGTIRHFGTSDSAYQTDVLSRKTNAFISRSASQGRPFFAYVAPKAPHDESTSRGIPPIPAPRDEHAFDGEQAPRSPSFDEEDVSDKPPWISSLPTLGTDQVAQIDAWHENRAESLQAVDDLMGQMVSTLRNARVMGNTYIIFTSDNGWQNGEHRIPSGKWRPYEESIHMPLLVRGPGVAAGSTTDKLALNTDYLPTLVDLAGAQIPPYVDGRSLRPVLQGTATDWRTAILLERRDVGNPDTAYDGIRTIGTAITTKRKYVKYAGGAGELYRLDADPYELTNRYDATTPPSGLDSRLRVLEGCAGQTCFRAENGP